MEEATKWLWFFLLALVWSAVLAAIVDTYREEPILTAFTKIPPDSKALVGLAVVTIVVLIFRLSGVVQFSYHDNQLYLLSAIVQGLAAILALLVTITLVFTQMVGQQFSFHVASIKIRDKWFWGAVAIYITAIVWALLGMAWYSKQTAQEWWAPWLVDGALLCAAIAVGYLVPYAVHNLLSLQPPVMAKAALDYAWRTGNYHFIEDMLQEAANEQLRTGFEAALTQFVNCVEERSRTTSSQDAHRYGKMIGEFKRLIERAADLAWQKRDGDLLEEVLVSLEKLRRAPELPNSLKSGVEEQKAKIEVRKRGLRRVDVVDDDV